MARYVLTTRYTLADFALRRLTRRDAAVHDDSWSIAVDVAKNRFIGVAVDDNAVAPLSVDDFLHRAAAPLSIDDFLHRARSWEAVRG